MLEVIGGEELLRRADRRPPTRIGHWRFVSSINVLEFDKPGCFYQVDLNEMKSSAGVLDWIAQVSHKAWASSEDIGDLVRLIDARLQLQKNYCGCGVEQPRRRHAGA